MFAPIVVFAYNRPDHLMRVLTALAANEEADRSELYIYCDGPKARGDQPKVRAVRNIARSASAFAGVTVVEQESNLGLSASIIRGVSEVCDRHGRAIVLEDDVISTPFFLRYMNDALDRYADDARVLSIGCHTFDGGVELPETFFLDVPDCWGWGVWQRSWRSFNPDGEALLAQIVARNAANQFDFDGAYPYTGMLEEQVRGGNQSWAVRWYAHAFLNQKLVLYPRRSVTTNIGFDGSGVHAGQSTAYKAVRTMDRPVVVDAVGVEQSELGREAWKAALCAMAGGANISLVNKIRSRLIRVCRPLVSHLVKARS